MTGSYQAQDRLHADEDLMEDLQWLLDRMVQEQKLMEPGFEQILNSSFFILITLVSRAFSEKITFTQRREADFAHTVAYMQTHYAQPLRIPQLAQMAHLSERQFNRRFKSIYHVSPSQFLVQLRMNRACILLEESGLNISEIAMECGFSDINYFSSSFRAMFGKSASQYRMERETEVKTSDLKRHRPKKENYIPITMRPSFPDGRICFKSSAGLPCMSPPACLLCGNANWSRNMACIIRSKIPLSFILETETPQRRYGHGVSKDAARDAVRPGEGTQPPFGRGQRARSYDV